MSKTIHNIIITPLVLLRVLLLLPLYLFIVIGPIVETVYDRIYNKTSEWVWIK